MKEVKVCKSNCHFSERKFDGIKKSFKQKSVARADQKAKARIEGKRMEQSTFDLSVLGRVLLLKNIEKQG